MRNLVSTQAATEVLLQLVQNMIEVLQQCTPVAQTDIKIVFVPQQLEFVVLAEGLWGDEVFA
jgi:hypothetical protein